MGCEEVGEGELSEGVWGVGEEEVVGVQRREDGSGAQRGAGEAQQGEDVCLLEDEMQQLEREGVEGADGGG